MIYKTLHRKLKVQQHELHKKHIKNWAQQVLIIPWFELGSSKQNWAQRVLFIARFEFGSSCNVSFLSSVLRTFFHWLQYCLSCDLRQHRWCNGQCVRLECGRSWVRARWVQTKEIKIVFADFPHATLTSKNKD